MKDAAAGAAEEQLNGVATKVVTTPREEKLPEAMERVTTREETLPEAMERVTIDDLSLSAQGLVVVVSSNSEDCPIGSSDTGGFSQRVTDSFRVVRRFLRNFIWDGWVCLYVLGGCETATHESPPLSAGLW